MKTTLPMIEILLKGLKGISIFLVCLFMGISFITIEIPFVGYALCTLFIFAGVFGFKEVIREEILNKMNFLK